MELIYIWIDKFRNFEKQSINLSNKFTVKYPDEKGIEIKENPDVVSIYPNHIKNINAIIGKNGVGKTNILDLIGLRIDNRNSQEEEYKIHYEVIQSGWSKGLECQTGYSQGYQYFLVYYIGKNEEGKNIFYFEGNHRSRYKHLLYHQNATERDTYFDGKCWFLYECEYMEDERKFKVHKGKQNIDKPHHLGVINLRENFNEKYVENESFDPKDENKISIPRRLGTFQTKYMYKQVEMLFKYMEQSNRLILQKEEYKLLITFNDHFFKMKEFSDEEEKYYNLPYSCSYSQLPEEEMKDKCRVIESFIYYYYYNAKYNQRKGEEMENIDHELSQIELTDNSSLDGYKSYYKAIFQKIMDTLNFYYPDMRDDAANTFERFVDAIMDYKCLMIYDSTIELVINYKTDIDRLKDFIEQTIDERITSGENGVSSLFNEFFDYYIDQMSDGEKAYLGFYASLLEQLELFAEKKTQYIILLDEPESRLHPELSRNFVNELIKFLEPCNNKSFQFIISSHSPFILSDILAENVVYVKKKSNHSFTVDKEPIRTFGANIHQLLKNSFFMEATLGEYAISKIKEVIAVIEDKERVELLPKERKYYTFIIDSIGEELIANQLRKKFNEKFNSSNLHKELEKYQALLKELEEGYLSEEKRAEWEYKKRGFNDKN